MALLALKDFAQQNRGRFLVLPLGVGNAFTTRFYNASFLVIVGGKVILVDAPAPIGRVLREGTAKAGLEASLADIDAVFLTHLHGDHSNGVEELGFYRMFKSEAGSPELFLVEGLQASLWAKLGPAMQALYEGAVRHDMSLERYFKVITLRRDATHDLGVPNLRFEVHPTRHGIPCYAFRASYNGCTLGYSADTPYDEDLLRFLEPADVIIHETSLGAVHTPYERLVALQEPLRRKIRLIHLGDEFDVEKSVLPVLEEGRIIEV